MHPLRTRFKKEIVAEFLPPARFNAEKPQKAVIICSGMPGMPRHREMCEFYSKKGYWVFYPRYRGSWESEGEFLKLSPEQDIKDILDELPKGLRDLTWGKKFKPKFGSIFVIGGSFGGPAALLISRDPRVKKIVAVSPVVDWKASTSRESERAETSDPSYVHFVKQAFGRGYNLSEKNWNKLRTGKFYNPMAHIKEFDGRKILMYHAKDDPVVRWKEVAKFAKLTGAKLVLRKKGGHLSSSLISKPAEWRRVSKFFRSK